MQSSDQLKRSLGLPFVIVLVAGNIIGSGVYKKVAPMAAELHSPGWVLICWVLGGIISLMGALSNAEVAGLLAGTGGEYVYYKKIYNKFFAFLFGWSLFTIIQTAAISSLAYVFAESLNSIIALPDVLPQWASVSIGGVFHPFTDLNVKLTAIVLIVLLTWINSAGIKAGAGFSTALIILILAGILLIIVFGFASPHSSISSVFDLKTTDGSTVTFSAVFTAMLAAFWAYQGWASTGFVGGEIKNVNRNLPLGIAIGVLIVIVIYLLVNTAYLSLLPVQSLEQIHDAGNKIAAVEAVRVFGGNTGVLLISLLICVTTLGCTNATILVSCRPYFAMAREGVFFKSVAKLNKAQVPGNSLMYQCVWAILLIFSGTFDQLTDMIIFAVFIYYGATTLGVFILRKKMPNAHRPYKVWGYPVVPGIVILFCAALFINTIIARPREAVIGMVLMLTGVPLYWWFQQKRKGEGEIE
ncbi:MAG: amino acid permease [Ferruginibacter sp.]|uniref:APC family permease n=1 Tax=Ferruginibacter sp. TaxID=1940288 RepID=UPI0026581CFB|nr:amino acid permease [Ferruginibacter sp.]MDB5276982.1 amino acid permease [Ferruginibacter sp.]